MGWPLLFQGNHFTCPAPYHLPGSLECNLEAACKAAPLSIQIKGKMTLTKEFRLICQKSELVSFANSLLFLSMVFSGFIFPLLSDLKGRKASLILASFFASGALVAASFVNSFLKWYICIAVAGFGIAGVEIISLVYVSEISAKRFRNHAMVALTTMWAVSQVFLGVIFEFVANWRWIFLGVIGAPYLVCSLLGWGMMLETPRYLLSMKEFEVRL
jgi:MFS family permease